MRHRSLLRLTVIFKEWWMLDGELIADHLKNIGVRRHHEFSPSIVSLLTSSFPKKVAHDVDYNCSSSQIPNSSWHIVRPPFHHHPVYNIITLTALLKSGFPRRVHQSVLVRSSIQSGSSKNSLIGISRISHKLYQRRCNLGVIVSTTILQANILTTSPSLSSPPASS